MGPIDRMYRRGRLGKGAEGDVRLKAGRHLERLYGEAVDATRDNPAATQIDRIEGKLGEDSADLLCLVLRHKFDLAVIAEEKAPAGSRAARAQVTYLGHLLRDALDTCAVMFGYKLAPRSAPRRPLCFVDHPPRQPRKRKPNASQRRKQRLALPPLAFQLRD
jgi:hypothetical protein